MLRLIVVALVGWLACSAEAAVILGPIDRWPESTGAFHWGEGTHILYQDWSACGPGLSGYFYGTSYSFPGGTWTNADVYNAGATDPLTVADASTFAYTDQSILATAGQTVFFRGSDGYYGAWAIASFEASGRDDQPLAYLTGTWYFQTDGTGHFVPEPSCLGLGILGLGLRRRRNHASR